MNHGVLKTVHRLQEAGAVIQNIVDIRDRIKYKVTVEHVWKDNSWHN